jgi:hypothetical protein
MTKFKLGDLVEYEDTHFSYDCIFIRARGDEALVRGISHEFQPPVVITAIVRGIPHEFQPPVVITAIVPLKSLTLRSTPPTSIDLLLLDDILNLKKYNDEI